MEKILINLFDEILKFHCLFNRASNVRDAVMFVVLSYYSGPIYCTTQKIIRHITVSKFLSDRVTGIIRVNQQLLQSQRKRLHKKTRSRKDHWLHMGLLHTHTQTHTHTNKGSHCRKNYRGITCSCR